MVPELESLAPHVLFFYHNNFTTVTTVHNPQLPPATPCPHYIHL